MTNRLFLFLLLFACRLAAQSGATVEGTVSDPQQRPIPGVAVQLEQLETGAVRTAQTAADGRFVAVALTPGPYRVTVRHSGFQALERRGVHLVSGRVARLDLELRIGVPSESITITAELPLVSPNAADWGGLVPERNLRELPLNGRDLFELSALEPGATLPASARNGLAQGLGGQISVKGSRPNQNSFQIDGVAVNDATGAAPASAAGNLLGLEAVREVHLVTDPFSAEYGRTAGGVFTAVSRSGGNRLHGSLYEYFRNNALDARNFFDAPSAAIPPLRRNHFGGLLSGPVAENKAFFLVNYEGLRQRLSRTVRPVTPTAEARLGRLPDRDIDVAESVKPYLDLYPLPNGRDFGDGTAEFVNQASGSTNEDFAAGKLDFVLSDAMQLSARYTFDDAENRAPDPLRLWTFGLDSRDHFLHGELRRVHSPNTLSTLRAAFSRVDNFENSTTVVPPELSFVRGLPMGTMTVNGLSDFGGFQARARPRRFILNSYQFSGEIVHTAGRGTWRAGGGFDRVQFDQRSDLSAVGAYTFDSPALLLQAAPRVAEVMQPGSDTVRDWRYSRFHGYIQNELRIHERLSLSLGLRYEAASTPTEADGKIAVLRDFINDAETTVGGPIWNNPSKDNFAPRASLAWDPLGDGKTVVRAGGGIFFDLLGSRELTIAGVRTPPFFNRILVFGRPRFPDILDAAAGRNPSSSMDGLDFDLNQPYVARWQLNLERQLGRETLLRLGYSGARGIHLLGQLINANTPVPERLDDGRFFFPAGNPRVNPAFSRIGLRRSQFNSFYQGLTLSLQTGFGDRLDVRGKYTWSRSIDEASNHTFNDFVASDQVPTVWDYRANRGLSDFDQAHVFAASFSYTVSKWSGTRLPALLGGWELHAIAQSLSGTPFAPRVGFDRARLRPAFGDVGQRPDLVSGRSADDIVLGDPARYFDSRAFALPAAGFLGNLGRGTLRSPGVFFIDLAVHKTLWANERHAVKLRCEMFNATNHPNFQVPSGRALFTGSGGRIGSAGRITQTATTPRQIQLALRWRF